MMGTVGGCMAGMVLTSLVGLVLLVGLAVGLVYLARGIGRGGQTATVGSGADEDRALALLRERYARGEIDHDEYERRRAALTSEMGWAR